MATYVNDLRLKEISTGDESGTWGTSTNTNLELIGEALGYATQQVFSSDADATTTVADGASDPARAMYFKITSAGSLTATRTCTIAPNTVSRVMFIENATSGSQSIAISQGSGANVTIATGKTAVVYLDGAGSGAAVVDAMAGVDPGVTDTLAEVLTAGNTTGGTDLAVSTGDDITFADSSKAIFGAGSDLQIYHDGSNSIINDAGTGTIRIQTAGANQWEFNGLNFKGNDGRTIVLGDSSDLQIYHDGSNSYIEDAGAGALIQLTNSWNLNNAADTQNMITATEGGDARLFYSGAGKLATTATGIQVTGDISNASGDLTLDVAGDINLDADGADINLKDGGTRFGILYNSASNFHIEASVLDKDIKFLGNDGGSGITALTLDMSEAGAATFNSSITIPDWVYHSGDSNTYFGFPSGDEFKVVTANVGRLHIKGSESVWNEGGENVDFRVESDGNANMLFVDGENNRVGIAESSPDALLHINATSQGNFQEALRLTNSGGGANEGAFIRFEISNASAHGAIIGARRSGSGGIDLRFDTGEINGAPVTAMTIDHDQRVGIGRVPSISNSKLEVGGADNVSLINVEASGNTGGMGIGSTGLQLFHGASSKVLIGSGGMVVNEASADYDFRVESNDNENMLFVDGGNNRVGIGKAAATHPLEVGVYAQFDTGMTINETGADADFRVESDGQANMLVVDGTSNRVIIGSASPNASHPTAQFQVGGSFTFSQVDLNSNTVTDTGISINQGNAGMAMQVLASNHSDQGTNTKAGQYFLKFYYNGNNAPAVTLVAGDDCVTFGVSGSNTLTVQMPAGANSISFITNG